MTNVEFIEPDPPETAVEPAAAAGPDGPAGQSGPASLKPYDADRTRFIAAGVLWLAAAILCVVAAYQQVYATGFGTGGSRFRYTLDAWGAYGGAGAIEANRHGPAYARILIVCAVLFAVLGVSALGRAFGLRARRFDSAAVAAGVGVAGILAGLLAALYLDVTSVLAGIRASLQSDVASGDPVRGDIVTTVGNCAYFALAALACAVVAVAASVLRRRPAD